MAGHRAGTASRKKHIAKEPMRVLWSIQINSQPTPITASRRRSHCCGG
jgi:hypothetical protein